MRIKLIEELPMATSTELYQLIWVVEQPLADPRRVVQVRAQLHTGRSGVDRERLLTAEGAESPGSSVFEQYACRID